MFTSSAQKIHTFGDKQITMSSLICKISHKWSNWKYEGNNTDKRICLRKDCIKERKRPHIHNANIQSTLVKVEFPGRGEAYRFPDLDKLWWPNPGEEYIETYKYACACGQYLEMREIRLVG